MTEIAREIAGMCQQARHEGILALDNKEFEDPFMESDVGIIVDGVDSDHVPITELSPSTIKSPEA